jgi:hypothetical protein
MEISASGRVGRAGGCPTVGAGVVPPAGVETAVNNATPDDHFTVGPHCRVRVAGRGRVGRGGGCPAVRAGIISAAGVSTVSTRGFAAPDDHFVASPYRRVI